MSLSQIAIDVTRGLWIKKQIEILTRELKAIEKRLEVSGLAGEQIPLRDETREGKQFLARGSDTIVPVRFESDQIIASFAPDSETHTALESIAGKHLTRFFADVRRFERVEDDGNLFRKKVRAVFSYDTAAEFIDACIARKKDGIAKCKTVIAWNEARDIA